MLTAYRNGEDLHRLTASVICDKEINEITKEERQRAKAVNFGFIFGMGVTRCSKLPPNINPGNHIG